MSKSTFHYVTYIRTKPERVWSALTDDTDFMELYWFGTRCESEWRPGSAWRMVQADGSITDEGEILEALPPKKLVIRWRHRRNPDLAAEGDSLCTIEIEPIGVAVKLSIIHTIERDPSHLIAAVSGGWPKIMANLKSLIETGSVVLADPGKK